MARYACGGRMKLKCKKHYPVIMINEKQKAYGDDYNITLNSRAAYAGVEFFKFKCIVCDKKLKASFK